MKPHVSPRNWSLTVKVPLLVALMMVAVGTIVSNVVLARLADYQRLYLRRVTDTYLDGLATAILPHVFRKDIWETYDTLDRARQGRTGVPIIYALVALPNDTVLAATDPRMFPVYAQAPEALTARFRHADLVVDDSAGRGWVRRTLRQDGIVLGRIFAEIDLSEVTRERRDVLITLILINGLLTLVFAVGGYVAVRRMVEPVAVLTGHVEQIRDGRLKPIPANQVERQSGEFGLLFRRFNEMAAAVDEREALAQRLANEEKLAVLGKLASGMAHEVNNPLGGMMNAVDTLRKHGADAAVRVTALGLLERGLAGIRKVVRAALVTYKGAGEQAPLTRQDVDDLRFLIQHEVSLQRLRLVWRNDLPESVPIDGDACRQAALNLLLNACAASPPNGEVLFEAEVSDGRVVITVADQGPGLPEEVARLLRGSEPDALPPEGSTGLGIWAAARLVSRLNGGFKVDTAANGGTRLTFSVPRSGTPEAELHAVA